MTASEGPLEPTVEMQAPPDEGRRFARLATLFDSPVTIAAAGFVVLILVLAVIGEAIAPYGANEIIVMNQLQAPSLTHLFGTDDLGRDVFSRVIIAARPSVMVSVVSVTLALVVGVTIGLLSGFFGGWTDTIISRCTEAPLTYSMTTAQRPCRRVGGSTDTMARSRTRPRILASSRKRCSWSSGTSSSFISLMATSFSKPPAPSSTALYTVPKPPRPRRAVTR